MLGFNCIVREGLWLYFVGFCNATRPDSAACEASLTQLPESLESQAGCSHSRKSRGYLYQCARRRGLVPWLRGLMLGFNCIVGEGLWLYILGFRKFGPPDANFVRWSCCELFTYRSEIFRIPWKKVWLSRLKISCRSDKDRGLHRRYCE